MVKIIVCHGVIFPESFFESLRSIGGPFLLPLVSYSDEQSTMNGKLTLAGKMTRRTQQQGPVPF